MKTVRVNLGKRSYCIHIGEGGLAKISSLECARQKSIFIITNKRVNSLFGSILQKYLKPLGGKILFHEVPDSEKAKSFSVYIKTAEALLRFARKTKPLIIAFGGGVIGDLAGFVASTYRRGVPYINISTTLLAQVDSAIGGKVAIDTRYAKNILGNFYQPKMVICDTVFLKTLPEKELRNGLVEIVKYGIIKDKGLFSFIDNNLVNILELAGEPLEHIIFKSCSIKARIVEKDEYDTKDLRAILNFGHTIGHAIEAASRYSKSITHGRAVALGMVMASHIAGRLGMAGKTDCEKINSLIKRIIPEIKIKGVGLKKILNAIMYDKKFVRGVNRFILPKRIGLVKIVDNIPQELIKEAIEKNA